MSHIYLARQPIVCEQEKLQAYEILYLNADNKSNISKDCDTSLSVVSSVLDTFATKDILSEHKAFIKVDEHFLMSELILSIPKDSFILCLLSDIKVNEIVRHKIKQLHNMGFTIGINDCDLSKENILKYNKVIDKISYFKMNTYVNMELEDKDLIIELQDQGIQVVATKIEDIFCYELAKELECDLYQGSWFSYFKEALSREFDPGDFHILKLYNMLVQDTNINEIISEFEQNYILSMQLLQFIYSANLHFRSQILSMAHVVSLVGRKPISQWLLLMLYAESEYKDESVPALMLMVKNRIELMQNILKVLKPDVTKNILDQAYLVGVLSLMGSVFHARLEEILQSIFISKVVKNALLHDKGTLGVIYKLVRDIEEINVEEIAAFSKKYRLDDELLQEVILKSIQNVNNFEKDFRTF